MGRRRGVPGVRLEEIDETTFRLRTRRSVALRPDAVRLWRLPRAEAETSRRRLRLLQRTPLM